MVVKLLSIILPQLYLGLKCQNSMIYPHCSYSRHDPDYCKRVHNTAQSHKDTEKSLNTLYCILIEKQHYLVIRTKEWSRHNQAHNIEIGHYSSCQYLAQ